MQKIFYSCMIFVSVMLLWGCTSSIAFPKEKSTQGQSSPETETALEWSREGGLSGFCDRLVILVSGKVTATNCQQEKPVQVGQIYMGADQLSWLMEKLNQLQPFEYTLSDPAVADAMTVKLHFFGKGSASASEEDRRALLDLATKMFLEAKLK